MRHIKLGTYGPRNQFRVMTRRLSDNILGLLGTDRSFYYGYFFRRRWIIGTGLRSGVLYAFLAGLHLFYDVIYPDTPRDSSLFVLREFHS